MRFFERFRTALGKYAEGVHDLGAGAEAGAIAAAEERLSRALPAPFREFVEQWNGGFLFQDDYVLYGVAGARTGEIRREGEEIVVGEGPSGSLRLDARGRVVALDAETEGRAIEGSDFERWLDATMAREGLVYDREGEFREGALDGVDLAAKVVIKRAEVAAKADPGAAAWQEELGRLLVEAGHEGRAAKAFERAVELEPGAAAAWFALGKLRRAAGDVGWAAEAFARAGEAEREPAEAAFAWAHAARAAAEAGRAEEAAALGAKARGAQESFVGEQRAAAEHLASEGDVEAAIERLELGRAVAGGDPEMEQALGRMRARKALRPI